MIRALIAEDNPVNRELLRELLEARDFEVAEACDGVEALEMIERQEPPNVLLLDISMPRMDGFELLRKLRQTPQWAGLRVLAVTAYAMRGDRERVLSAGFDGYVSKPISVQLLSAELDRVLRSRSSPAQGSQTGGGD